MTMQVPKSIATPEFLARVEAFRQAKLDHHKTTGVPAPVEHDLVEACIKRVSRSEQPDDHVIDYEIVDDTPSLDERKASLIRQVAQAEDAALAAISPVGKRRLNAMKVAEIASRPESERSAEDVQFLAHQQERATRWVAINRHAAEQQAEIEDLTAETVDAWQAKVFPA